MKMFKELTLLSLLLGMPVVGLAAPLEQQLSIERGQVKAHVGIYEAKTERVLGDILYFHGYGDHFKNHEQLFQSWNERGFRVVAFDLPSHGGTKSLWDLDCYSFSDLAKLAAEVDSRVLVDRNRPFFLAGWSMGGLLATRIGQSADLQKLFERKIQGLFLYAPGVSVYPCVGRACFITNDTLTHDPGLQNRTFSPATPITRIHFAASLLFNGYLARQQMIPIEIPAVVFIGGDREDAYAKTPELKNWIRQQRKWQNGAGGQSVITFQCTGAFHELDNESTEFGGPQVRAISGMLAEAFVQGMPGPIAEGPCKQIE